MLKGLEDIIENLPSDESLMEINDLLVMENGLLDLLYRELSEREGN